MIAAAMVNTIDVTATKNAPLRMVCALIIGIHAMWVCGCYLIYAQIGVLFFLIVR